MCVCVGGGGGGGDHKWTADYSHKGSVMQKGFHAMTSFLYKQSDGRTIRRAWIQFVQN